MEGLIISIISGLATTFGGLISVLLKKINDKSISLFLGLAAGISLTVVILDLLPSALEYGSIFITATGFLVGILLMFILDRKFPHVHNHETEGGHSCDTHCLQRVGLFYTLGIILHNLPEGLAIGAGYEITPRLGLLLAFTIALHNIPEGMTLAVSLRAGGYKKLKTLLVTSMVGLFIPVGTLFGGYIFAITKTYLSLFLALGAGTLMFIIVKELLPEATKHHFKLASTGVTIGVIAFSIIYYFS